MPRLYLTVMLFLPALAFSQNAAMVSYDLRMKDTFSFANQWSYPWNVIQDEATGRFVKNEEGKLTASDTAHLFFTARCTTRVQGGYDIRYCYAEKKGDTLLLDFSDGLPAYASNFLVTITGDHFYFQPRLIYPVARSSKQTHRYEITKQSLTLNQKNYKPGDIVMGSIDIEFIEHIDLPGGKKENSTLFLKGVFRIAL